MGALGLYISVPFCKAKCSFCNFASDVFGPDQMQPYVDRLKAEIAQSEKFAQRLGADFPDSIDSIYLGGGTPSLLPPGLIGQLFQEIRAAFSVQTNSEITVECAPGQLDEATLEAFQTAGVNRLSFGVQSFIDRECSAVGRLHTGAQCRAELKRMASAGVSRVGIDLIVGLPHQTQASWRQTLAEAVDSGVDHVSLYMLEVDDDSRLGREAIAGGSRYGANALPSEDQVADWFSLGVEHLMAAGIRQYEISNFARPERESTHNIKYWKRHPYLGIGMDAHSMLRIGSGGVRWCNPDSMGGYGKRLGIWERKIDWVNERAAIEETMFLGLRMVEGIDLSALDPGIRSEMTRRSAEMVQFLVEEHGHLKLTEQGRMISNEIFERLLLVAA